MFKVTVPFCYLYKKNDAVLVYSWYNFMKSNRKIKVANNHTEGERIWIIGDCFLIYS